MSSKDTEAAIEGPGPGRGRARPPRDADRRAVDRPRGPRLHVVGRLDPPARVGRPRDPLARRDPVARPCPHAGLPGPARRARDVRPGQRVERPVADGRPGLRPRRRHDLGPDRGLPVRGRGPLAGDVPADGRRAAGIARMDRGGDRRGRRPARRRAASDRRSAPGPGRHAQPGRQHAQGAVADHGVDPAVGRGGARGRGLRGHVRRGRRGPGRDPADIRGRRFDVAAAQRGPPGPRAGCAGAPGPAAADGGAPCRLARERAQPRRGGRLDGRGPAARTRGVDRR